MRVVCLIIFFCVKKYHKFCQCDFMVILAMARVYDRGIFMRTVNKKTQVPRYTSNGATHTVPLSYSPITLSHCQYWGVCYMYMYTPHHVSYDYVPHLAKTVWIQSRLFFRYYIACWVSMIFSTNFQDIIFVITWKMIFFQYHNTIALNKFYS